MSRRRSFIARSTTRQIATLILAILSICLPGHLQAATPLSLGNTVLPYVGAEEFNPALAVYRGSWDHGPPVTLPLGTAGLVRGEHNPLGFRDDPDTFFTRFDTLSFYEQLIHPGRFLFILPQSPEAVKLTVAARGLTLSDGAGEPLDLGVAGGRSGIAMPRSALVPPPVISVPYRTGPFHMRSGLFLGETGHSLEGNEAFEALLAGAPQQPGVEYGVTASAGVAGGISHSVSYLLEHTIGNTGVRIAPALRATGFILLAYADATSRATIVLNNDGSLPATGTTAEMFYLYPGKGIGGGGRLDLGMLVEKGNLAAGLSVLNAVGVVAARGVGRSLDDGFAEREADWLRHSAGPNLVAHAAYRVPMGGESLYLLADSGYGRSARLHVAAILAGPRIQVMAGGGWRGTPEAGMGAAVRVGPIWLEGSLTYHRAAFTGESVVGGAISIARASQ